MWKEPRVSMAQGVRRDPQVRWKRQKKEGKGGGFSGGADSGGEGR